MSKEGLQKVIQREQTDSLLEQVEIPVYTIPCLVIGAAYFMSDNNIYDFQGNFLSTEDLRDLFTFDENLK